MRFVKLYELAACLALPRPEKTELGDGQSYAWLPRTTGTHIVTNQDQ